MTADPRVEAVAEALVPLENACVPENECYWECSESALSRMRDYAVAAVAALDAYTAREAGYPTMRDSDEADLRERIAQEIEAAHRTAPDCCAYDVAARIARGQS